MDEHSRTKPPQHVSTLRQRRGWRRRYASTRAVVALVVLASFIAPGIAAVIGAVVVGW
jgi:integral membrane sensor domain MASE1